MVTDTVDNEIFSDHPDLTVRRLVHDVHAIYGMVGDIQETLREHSGRLDGIDTRLDGIDTRLDGIGGRLDGIGGRLDGMGGRLDGMDGKLDEILRRLAG